jgi:AhpD family alkylhydroperoxidase
MTNFEVPTPEQVSPANQEIFGNLKKSLGFIPNIYATYAYSDHALGRYMAFAGGKTSLSNKEKEVVNLVVSQVNGCKYCQAAHTAIGKMNGFSDEQVIEIRKGEISFDPKLNSLAKLVKDITENRGKTSTDLLQDFFDAGYNKGSLVDVIVAIGDKTTTNLLHNITEIPLDFPAAPELA